MKGVATSLMGQQQTLIRDENPTSPTSLGGGLTSVCRSASVN